MSFYFVLLIVLFDFYLEEEIDGIVLARLSFDELRVLLPKLKDRVLFTEKRDILIKTWNNNTSEQLVEQDTLNECSKQTFDTSNESQITTTAQDLLNDTRSSSNDVDNETLGTTSNGDTQVNEDEHDNLEEHQQELPLVFEFVSLPEGIQVIVDENELTKLRGHTNHRRILLNFVFQHVVSTYNLLYRMTEMNFINLRLTFVSLHYRYPKANDYLIIIKGLLQALKIPVTDKNLAVKNNFPC